MLKKMNFDLFATLGTADFYTTHNVPMKAVDWPFNDNGKNGGNGKTHSSSSKLLDIGDYLAQRKIDLFINLPLRQHRLDRHGCFPVHHHAMLA